MFSKLGIRRAPLSSPFSVCIPCKRAQSYSGPGSASIAACHPVSLPYSLYFALTDIKAKNAPKNILKNKKKLGYTFKNAWNSTQSSVSSWFSTQSLMWTKNLLIFEIKWSHHHIYLLSLRTSDQLRSRPELDWLTCVPKWQKCIYLVK